MSSNELALLALVVDSSIDYRVLAAWIGCKFTLKQMDRAAADIARICGMNDATVAGALVRLRTAQLLTDEGTTEVGLRWLQATVSSRLPKTKRKA